MQYLPRGIEGALRSRFERDAVVILEGARATGKTSILNEGLNSGWITDIRTFMDPTELAAAKEGPQSYVESLRPGTAIDEVQLAEEITLAIKARVDNDDAPGQLILTGSTRMRRNALGGSDPLAGRVNSPLVLRPMTMGERRGQPLNILETLLEGDPTELALGPRLGRSDLIEVTSTTGLPGLIQTDAVSLEQRSDAYLSSVTALEAFESRNARNIASLARYLAGRTSTIVNINQFSKAVEISRATVENYLAHLEDALLIHRLPGWRSMKDKSETDKPKIHFFDTGVAHSLAQLEPGAIPDQLGRLAETLVVSELLSQSSWLEIQPHLYHWRRNNDKEVDLVLEFADGRIICVEVKSAEAVSKSDFSGIEAFRTTSPDRFHRGFVFYSGEKVLPFGDDLWAIPFTTLRPGVQTGKSVSVIFDSIAIRRAERTRDLEAQDRRALEYVKEVERTLEQLRDSLKGDYSLALESRKSNGRLAIGLSLDGSLQEGEPLYLIRVLVDMEEAIMTGWVDGTAASPGSEFFVALSGRTAVDAVFELFEKSEVHLYALLASWDDAKRAAGQDV